VVTFSRTACALVFSVFLSQPAFSDAEDIAGVLGLFAGIAQQQKVSEASKAWQSFPEPDRSCLVQGLSQAGNTLETVVSAGIGPDDPQLQGFRDRCTSFKNIVVRRNFSCQVDANGRSFNSWCDERLMAQFQGGQLVAIEVEQAIEYAYRSEQLQLQQEERQDAAARRTDMMRNAPTEFSVPAPNFDCDKADSASEKTVCISYALSLLDAEFGALFQRAVLVPDGSAARAVGTEEYNRTERCNGQSICIRASKEQGVTGLAVILRARGEDVTTSVDLRWQAESKKRREDEAKRRAEEERLAAAKAERERKAEEARQAEAERQAKQKEKEEREAEEKRIAEETRLAELKAQERREAEAKALAEAARLAELKERARKAAEARKAKEEAELARKAEEVRKAEDARREQAELQAALALSFPQPEADVILLLNESKKAPNLAKNISGAWVSATGSVSICRMLGDGGRTEDALLRYRSFIDAQLLLLLPQGVAVSNVPDSNCADITQFDYAIFQKAELAGAPADLLRLISSYKASGLALAGVIPNTDAVRNEDSFIQAEEAKAREREKMSADLMKALRLGKKPGVGVIMTSLESGALCFIESDGSDPVNGVLARAVFRDAAAVTGAGRNIEGLELRQMPDLDTMFLGLQRGGDACGALLATGDALNILAVAMDREGLLFSVPPFWLSPEEAADLSGYEPAPEPVAEPEGAPAVAVTVEPEVSAEAVEAVAPVEVAPAVAEVEAAPEAVDAPPAQAVEIAAPQMPQDQVAFISAVESAREAYATASNDMAKGGVRSVRGEGVCAAVPNGEVRDWLGIISELSSNGDGFGVLSIEVAPNVYLKTWNNSLSDIMAGTLIDPKSDLFAEVSGLSVSLPVVFSASLISAGSGSADCFNEASLTLNGSMTEPEYIARFSAVRAE
jgi:hypothetical protein